MDNIFDRTIGLFGEDKFEILDGQQRITSLYAVMKGKPIHDKNYNEKTITISYNPLENKFEIEEHTSELQSRE